MVMQITWDERKAKANLAKHRVAFADAELVLSDPLALTVEDRMLKANSDSSPWARMLSVVSWRSSTRIAARPESE